MKKSIKLLLILFAVALIALIAAFFFAKGAGGNEDIDAEDISTEEITDGADEAEEDLLGEGSLPADDPTLQDYDTGISFEEEDEDAELTFKQNSGSSFVGSWTATSSQAAYLYGNVDLTIKSDGTWTGDITGEKLKGTWKEQGDGIYLTSEIFNCSLRFTDGGKLTMLEDYEDSDAEAAYIVLTAK